VIILSGIRNNGNLKFYSASKSLTLPSQELWSGKHKNDAIALINKIIEERGFKKAASGKALLPTFFGSKNA
jgi:hypothetical protein